MHEEADIKDNSLKKQETWTSTKRRVQKKKSTIKLDPYKGGNEVDVNS